MRRPLRARLLPAAARWLPLALAAACAGGGPAGAAPPAPAVKPCNVAALRAEMLRRVNEWRAQARQCGSEGAFGAAPALAWNDALARAAAVHSRSMAQHDFMEHEGRDGSTVVTRVEAQGYQWSRVAENIAGGQPTVAEVVDSWRRSPGHCANLMKPDLRHVGAACMQSPATRYRVYWTLVLGTPQQQP
jgi:uncharacterized protein YkwD